MITADMVIIVVTGALVAGSCALLGSFLILRRLALLGDAISHAVLPGIVIAYLISNSRASMIMFLGAVVFGLLTTFLVQFLSDKGVQGDAAIGVAFTFLFAVGVVLVSIYGQSVDLDLDCVLYGEIAYSPFDVMFVGGEQIGPRPLWINGVIFALNLLLVSLFYKQFKLSAFDPAMAAAVGIPVTAIHYMLMLQVSVTTVGAFESVGAILVVAMFIVPPATAYLLTHRLSTMIGLSVGIGAFSSLGGYFMARSFDASIAGSMATVSGAMFLAALLFSPSQGIVMRALDRLSLGKRVEIEDILLWALRRQERQDLATFALADVAKAKNWGTVRARSRVHSMVSNGLLTSTPEGYVLHDSGKDQAMALIKTHRLYEQYLGDVAGYAKDHTHNPAHRAEHFINEETADKLKKELKSKK